MKDHRTENIIKDMNKENINILGNNISLIKNLIIAEKEDIPDPDHKVLHLHQAHTVGAETKKIKPLVTQKKSIKS